MGDGVLLHCMDYFRGISFPAMALRMCLALILGGLLGLERVRKRRPAGIRTYMLVCIGAALTMILGQYTNAMLGTVWSEAAQQAGIKADIARFSAQVINGIGFLGAGTVLITGKQQVKGLTTAAGLWASACMGLAIGAGYLECAILAFVLIFICNRILPHLENSIVENAKNINLYVEFEALDDIGPIITQIKSVGATVYEVELERTRESGRLYPSATISLRLNQRKSHARLMLAISKLQSVHTIEEI